MNFEIEFAAPAFDHHETTGPFPIDSQVVLLAAGLAPDGIHCCDERVLHEDFRARVGSNGCDNDNRLHD